MVLRDGQRQGDLIILRGLDIPVDVMRERDYRVRGFQGSRGKDKERTGPRVRGAGELMGVLRKKLFGALFCKPIRYGDKQGSELNRQGERRTYME